MGDFHQNGNIATLHNLSRRPVEELERDLIEFSRHRPMGLVVPSLYSELATPALDNIVRELSRVPYLNEIVVGLDRADEKEYRHALEFFGRLPQHHRVLWNDGPRLRALDRKLAEKGLSPTEPGKGRNVWFCYGYTLATGRASTVALHDADIKTYRRDLLARLIYPVANPGFSFDFSKGYYARSDGTTMQALRELGCEFALDDFGSGLSSFGYLKRLPVDYVKIDGVFVKDIVEDHTDRMFVKAIIDIAHSLGIKAIAECVESEQTFEIVRELGADFAQGFHLHEPELMQPSLPGGRMLVGAALNNLGWVLSDGLARYADGEAVLRRAVDTFTRQADPDDYWNALSRWSLANNLRDQQRYDDADGFYREARAILERSGGSERAGNPSLDELLSDYAAMLRAAGRDAQANAL